MQVIRTFAHDSAATVSWGVRVLLLSSDGEGGQTGRRLAGMGGQVDVADELYQALSEVIDDPAGYGLFVVDCDSANVGGLKAARRAMTMLGEVAQRVPVILISSECDEQRFPMDRTAPTLLRAPLSAVSLKVGFEHALRDRLMYRAA